METWESRVQGENKVLQVLLDLRAFRDSKEKQDTWACQERRETVGLPDLKEVQEGQEQRVSLVQWVHKDVQVHQAI